jgi:hypothetical protein
VFTGIPRNSITEDEYQEIIKGNTVTKYTINNFFHDNISLNISNKNITRTVKFTPPKILIDNNYQALHLIMNKIPLWTPLRGRGEDPPFLR